MGIYTGWEESIKFPKTSTPPDVMGNDFEELPKKVRNKSGKEVTLADLKSLKSYVMHGSYIRPFSNNDKAKKKKLEKKKDAASEGKKKTNAPKKAVAVHGMFAEPKNTTRTARKKK